MTEKIIRIHWLNQLIRSVLPHTIMFYSDNTESIHCAFVHIIINDSYFIFNRALILIPYTSLQLCIHWSMFSQQLIPVLQYSNLYFTLLLQIKFNFA